VNAERISKEDRDGDGTFARQTIQTGEVNNRLFSAFPACRMPFINPSL